jgi:tRNA-(ms[2]io[6]A)-hydroxylase
MLGLQFETKTSWAEIAKDDLQQILTDHAFLEQKAASNAVSIIINYSEETALVKEMSTIAIEEMQHFKMTMLFACKSSLTRQRTEPMH